MSNPVHKREHDSLAIPEGWFVELYVPAAGRITSTELGGKKLAYAKMILSEDANVTFKSASGGQVTAFPLSKGPVPFLVSEISVVSAGTVLIAHNGLVHQSDSSLRGMTDAFSIT
jgi:hypothetical protein